MENLAKGTILEFNDGEEWLIVKIKYSDVVIMKPYNDFAKNRNISMEIETSTEYINRNIRRIK